MSALLRNGLSTEMYTSSFQVVAESVVALLPRGCQITSF